MVALDLPKPAKVTTPLLVIGVGRDNMLTPKDALTTARAYNARLETIPDVAHDSMLEVRWQAVADRILGWLKARAPLPHDSVRWSRPSALSISLPSCTD